MLWQIIKSCFLKKYSWQQPEINPGSIQKLQHPLQLAQWTAYLVQIFFHFQDQLSPQQQKQHTRMSIEELAKQQLINFEHQQVDSCYDPYRCSYLCPQQSTAANLTIKNVSHSFYKQPNRSGALKNGRKSENLQSLKKRLWKLMEEPSPVKNTRHRGESKASVVVPLGQQNMNKQSAATTLLRISEGIDPLLSCKNIKNAKMRHVSQHIPVNFLEVMYERYSDESVKKRIKSKMQSKKYRKIEETKENRPSLIFNRKPSIFTKTISVSNSQKRSSNKLPNLIFI